MCAESMTPQRQSHPPNDNRDFLFLELESSLEARALGDVIKAIEPQVRERSIKLSSHD